MGPKIIVKAKVKVKPDQKVVVKAKPAQKAVVKAKPAQKAVVKVKPVPKITDNENTYSKQLQQLIAKIKNQYTYTDNGIRFGWKNN